jgi:hypothetical protein
MKNKYRVDVDYSIEGFEFDPDEITSITGIEGSIGFCMQMFTKNILVPYSRAESLKKSLSLENQHSES